MSATDAEVDVEVVLDLGCGAGIDLLIAAQMTGPTGRLIGVDMTASMLEHARASADDRVLRPGGRLQLADVIIHHEVSEDARKRIDLWTG
jgi:cyclopropane fatty-acyl-phospholipid synthase-like methyltransferase